MKLNFEITGIDRAKAAFEKAPGVMNRRLSLGLDRAAQEVAREARSAAPKAFSNLMNSINWTKEGEFTRLVAPAKNYAVYVEKGTRPGKMPNREALAPWLHQKTGATGRDLRNRSFLLARYIQRHGTKAQPFMAPTAAKMDARVKQILSESVQAGVQEVFG